MRRMDLHRESAELQLICMNRNLSDHANPFKRTKKERHIIGACL